MSKLIQLEGVPDSLYERLEARAATHGQPLSDYLLGELERIVGRSINGEILARLEDRGPIETGESSADALRAERRKRWKRINRGR